MFSNFLIFFTAPPIFLVEPTDQKVAEGAPASLDCIASGNPTPTLFWIKESSPGIILPATTNGVMTVTPEGTLRIGKLLKMSEIVQKCLKLFKLVQTCQSLPEIFQKVSKIVQIEVGS